ncbi:MAG: SDR family oxidoreductase [Candidatus Cloacimonadaceae bacterium]|nr:SDR family oxidoreductase [Candidatus Cloacimonadaceae bacterium]
MNKGFTIITGANGQVGSHLARSFATKGVSLLLLYHDRQDRLAGFDDAKAVLTRACDLADPINLTAFIEEAKRVFNLNPTVFIHCASLRSFDAKALVDSDPAIFHKILTTNVMGFYHVLRSVLPDMIFENFGRIVVFGSAVTQTGLMQGSAYAAAKAAMVNIVKSTAREVASHNILINAISSAPIETNLEADYQGEYLQFRQDYFSRYQGSSPTGKLVSIKEIEAIVELLVKPELENLTAQEIFIHGASQ